MLSFATISIPNEFRIIGRTADGREVAWDRADTLRRAEQIAATWRASGLTVEIVESRQ